MGMVDGRSIVGGERVGSLENEVTTSAKAKLLISASSGRMIAE
jgi:hypothetical protein